MAKHTQENLVVLQFTRDRRSVEVVDLGMSNAEVDLAAGIWWERKGALSMSSQSYVIGSARVISRSSLCGAIGVYDRTSTAQLSSLAGHVHDVSIYLPGPGL